MRFKILLLIVATLLLVAGCGGNQKTETLLLKGAAAPGFSVQDHRGQDVTLAELHKEGPLILTFLRSFF